MIIIMGLSSQHTLSRSFDHNGIKHSHTLPYHSASFLPVCWLVVLEKSSSHCNFYHSYYMLCSMYRSIPHTTTGMRPEKLLLPYRIKTCFTLISPNLILSVEHQQQKQKITHDGKKPLVILSKGEKVLASAQQAK